ncbi:MAG: hypothetical protein LBQ76_08570 [Candidatus Fibromonas sp.]|jgi:hypothetical protein|nr:hypothetical protein [Candidatus Fibromonas sp.]
MDKPKKALANRKMLKGSEAKFKEFSDDLAEVASIYETYLKLIEKHPKEGTACFQKMSEYEQLHLTDGLLAYSLHMLLKTNKYKKAIRAIVVSLREEIKVRYTFHKNGIGITLERAERKKPKAEAK